MAINEQFQSQISDETARVRELVGARLDNPATVPKSVRTAETLAGRIDHTALKATTTKADVEKLCDEAIDNGFASVCVNSRWVPLAAAKLKGKSPMVCTVVGFPLGAMSKEAKAEETRIAVTQGANEVDMVLDIGAMLDGDLNAVLDDMSGVVEAARPVPVKVIFETCYLRNDQIIAACLLSRAAGAAYVKTSTGMAAGGATAEHIALMRAVVGDELGVKASGAIRTRADVDAMLEAGADRIGASAGIAIISGDDSVASSEGGY